MADLKVELSVKDNLSPALSKAEMGFAKLKASAEGNAKGIRQLDNTFQNAIQSSLGLTGATGQLAGALIEFIPGGLVVGAVIGGVAMMINYYNNLGIAIKKAQDANAQLGIQLLKMQGKDVAAARLGVLYAGEALQKAKFDLEELKTLSAYLSSQTYIGSSLVNALQDRLILQSREAVVTAERNLGMSQETVKKAVPAEAQRDTQAALDARTPMQKLIDSQKASAAATQLEIKYTQKNFDAIRDLIIQKEKLKKLNESIAVSTTPIELPKIDIGNLLPDAATIIDPILADMARRIIEFDIMNKFNKDMAAASAASEAETKKSLAATAAAKKLAQEEEHQRLLLDRLSVAAEAYEMLFSVIGQGGAAYAQLGQAFTRMIGDMAKKKAMFELAEGVAALAKVTPGPGAAIGHFKAAALFAAIAGLASAGASAIGANNQGSRRDPNSNLGDPRGLEMGTVTINIVGGGFLDMNNADTQRSFVKAIEAIGNKRVVVSGGR